MELSTSEEQEEQEEQEQQQKEHAHEQGGGGEEAKEKRKPNTKQRCALESEFERNAHCCNGQIGIRSGEHHRLALVVSACFHHDGFRRRQGSRGGNRGNQGLERARFFTAVAIASAWRYVADERSGRCEMRDTLLV